MMLVYVPHLEEFLDVDNEPTSQEPPATITLLDCDMVDYVSCLLCHLLSIFFVIIHFLVYGDEKIFWKYLKVLS